jgi:hypothetical protein
VDCQRDWIESIAVALKPGGINVLATTIYMENVPTEYLTIKYVFPGGQGAESAFDVSVDGGV